MKEVIRGRGPGAPEDIFPTRALGTPRERWLHGEACCSLCCCFWCQTLSRVSNFHTAFQNPYVFPLQHTSLGPMNPSTRLPRGHPRPTARVRASQSRGGSGALPCSSTASPLSLHGPLATAQSRATGPLDHPPPSASPDLLLPPLRLWV